MFLRQQNNFLSFLFIDNTYFQMNGYTVCVVVVTVEFQTTAFYYQNAKIIVNIPLKYIKIQLQLINYQFNSYGKL